MFGLLPRGPITVFAAPTVYAVRLSVQQPPHPFTYHSISCLSISFIHWLAPTAIYDTPIPLKLHCTSPYLHTSIPPYPLPPPLCTSIPAPSASLPPPPRSLLGCPHTPHNTGHLRIMHQGPYTRVPRSFTPSCPPAPGPHCSRSPPHPPAYLHRTPCYCTHSHSHHSRHRHPPYTIPPPCMYMRYPPPHGPYGALPAPASGHVSTTTKTTLTSTLTSTTAAAAAAADAAATHRYHFRKTSH